MLEGCHLLSHSINVGRTLRQSPRPRFFERQQQNSANRKHGDSHRHVTSTSGHVTEKHCRTNYQMKIAVTRTRSFSSQNHSPRLATFLVTNQIVFYQRDLHSTPDFECAMDRCLALVSNWQLRITSLLTDCKMPTKID